MTVYFLLFRCILFSFLSFLWDRFFFFQMSFMLGLSRVLIILFLKYNLKFQPYAFSGFFVSTSSYHSKIISSLNALFFNILFHFMITPIVLISNSIFKRCCICVLYVFKISGLMIWSFSSIYYNYICSWTSQIPYLVFTHLSWK